MINVQKLSIFLILSLLMAMSVSALTITSDANTDARVDVAYTYTIEVDDDENVTFSLLESPSGMDIDEDTGEISWTPDETGEEDVEVLAENSFTGENDTQSFTIDVEKASILSISEVNVYIDDEEDLDLDNGTGIDIEPRPNEIVKFKVEVENTDSSLDLEEVVITIEISNIDDGDDLEEETSEFTLDAGDSESETLQFLIPLIVEDGGYDVTITAEGVDEDDTTHSDKLETTLTVDKKSQDVSITGISLGSPVVACGSSTTLEVEITNIGSKDANSGIRVRNSDLGINEFVEKELEKYVEDEDNEVTYEKSFFIKAPEGIEPGTYTLIIESYILGDEISERAEQDIKVTCATDADDTDTDDGEDQSDDTDGNDDGSDGTTDDETSQDEGAEQNDGDNGNDADVVAAQGGSGDRTATVERVSHTMDYVFGTVVVILILIIIILIALVLKKR